MSRDSQSGINLPAESSTNAPRFWTSRRSELLISYFRSGWAFLIPYLATYLLYAWLKWPVNPVEVTSTQVSAFRPPCLLHVYWFLHALHLILASLALRVWWRHEPIIITSSAHGLQSSNRDEGVASLNRVWPLIPWLLLALIFWIPGPYLEFPADTWAHVGRITMWEHYTYVYEHPTWTKSSYFLYASLLPPASMGYWPRVAGITFLQTGTSLLLCWQQFRLAQSLGLGRRSAFVFVLLQTLMMGNSSFSFYRYYSLSSSIAGQIAATALVVIVVRRLFGNSCSLVDVRSLRWPLFGMSIASLGLLCAFNHPQNVAMAAVAITAVVAGKLIVRDFRFVLAIFAVAMAGSILAIHYYPRHVMLDQYYVPAGWLTQIYSFNLFSFGSPAVIRSVQILGAAGLLNLIVAIALLRHHLLASLLCIGPMVALLIPLFSLPFASALASGLETPVQLFHRLYFAIPAGIALVLGVLWIRKRWHSAATSATWNQVVLISALIALVSVPSGYPWFSRSYHLLMHPAADASYVPMRRLATKIDPERLLMTTPGGEYAASSWNGIHGLYPLRVLRNQTAVDAFILRSGLKPNRIQSLTIIPAVPLNLYTPASTLGRISGHWSPVATALDYIMLDTSAERPDH